MTIDPDAPSALDAPTIEAPPSTERLVIFDTTLRDGEQSPGAAMNVDQKIAVAQQLARLRVDVIEAGFPNASLGDFTAVREIAAAVQDVTIAGLARVWPPDDVDRAGDALATARRRRIHTFVGTSPIHRGMMRWATSRDIVLERAVNAVRAAVHHTAEVEFSPMDASRTERDFLAEIIAAAIDAGATTINVPDTVGYATPEAWAELMSWLYIAVPKLSTVILSVHCHDDLGLAVANSLAAVRAGARQVEACINGIGERAGNAALEEVATAVRIHPATYGVHTGIDHAQLHRTSRLVSQMTGMLVQPNKAVVGANAFSHASGIHQDGMLKDQSSFEILNAAEVGADSRMVLGKLSGRHAVRARLAEMGYHLDDEQLERAFVRFKELADKKREVTDGDLEAMIASEVTAGFERFHLELLEVSSGTDVAPTARVQIIVDDGLLVERTATGDGPVNAIYRAINEIAGMAAELTEFRVQEVTAGIDAVGGVNVRVAKGKRIAVGHGADTDILIAAARAYVDALNRLWSMGDAEVVRLTPERSAMEAVRVAT